MLYNKRIHASERPIIRLQLSKLYDSPADTTYYLSIRYKFTNLIRYNFNINLRVTCDGLKKVCMGSKCYLKQFTFEAVE